MAQNKDFGAVLQTDLLEFSFVCGAGFHHSCEYYIKMKICFDQGYNDIGVVEKRIL